MKVYRLSADVGKFQWMFPIDSEDREMLRRALDPDVLLPATPIALKVVDETQDRPSSDFPESLPGIPVFSHRAKIALGDILDRHGQVIPMMCGDQEYYGLRVTTIVDALDMDKADLVMFEGSLMAIRRYAFHGERLGDNMLFKVPQAPVEIFVQQPVVAAVRKHRFSGFQFELVWEEEP